MKRIEKYMQRPFLSADNLQIVKKDFNLLNISSSYISLENLKVITGYLFI